MFLTNLNFIYAASISESTYISQQSKVNIEPNSIQLTTPLAFQYSSDTPFASTSINSVVDDYSNNIVNAYTISDKKTYSGKIELPYDADVFSFISLFDSDVLINFHSNSITASVLDYKGREYTSENIYDFRISNFSGPIIKFHATKNTKYYIKIKGVLSTTPEYSFNYEYLFDDYSNTFENAEFISDNTTITGNLIDDEDVDIFKFNATKGSAYSIDFDKYRCNFSVYDENNVEQPIMQSYIVFKSDATYYIKVKRNLAYNNLFKYSFKLSSPILDDYGNTKESAVEINADETVNGSIDYITDTDFFSFIPNKNGMYFIYGFSTKDNTNDLDNNFIHRVCKIYDSNGNTISPINNDYYNMNKNEKYYISFSTNPNMITLNKYSFKVKEFLIDEDGNSFESARLISEGTSISGEIDSFSDFDTYIFIPSSDGEYCINFNRKVDDLNNPIYCPTNLMDTLSVFSEQTGIMDKSGYDNNSKANFYMKKDTVYFITVWGIHYNPFFKYTLSMEGPLADDYGNTTETSSQIQIEKKVDGKLDFFGDTDYFKFSPSISGIYYFGDNSTNWNPNFIFKIYDGNGNVTGIGSNSGKIYFYASKDDIYYISTSQGFNSSLGNYSFTLKGPVIDEGNNNETAKTIDVSTNIVGFSNYSGDTDVFKFTSQTDAHYRMDFNLFSNYGFSNFCDIFNIYDKDGNKIYVKIFNFCADFDLKKDTDYYFTIVNPGFPEHLGYSFNLNKPIIDDYSNTKDKSYEIKTDTVINGEIGHLDDCDYFKFTPSSTGRYFLHFLEIESADPDSIYSLINVLHVEDSSDKPLKFSLNDSNTAFLDLKKDYTYYLRIGDMGTNPLYKYSYQLEGPVVDDYGNSYFYSKTLNVGETVNGKFESGGDIDFFDFNTTSKGLYCISTPDNIDIKVLNNNYVDEYPINIDSSDSEHYFYFEEDETYYISVKSYYSSASEYSFNFKGPIYDDYPNILSGATIIQSNTPINGSVNYLGDIDKLQFIPQDSGFVYFRFDAPSNISLKLSDSTQSNIKYLNIKDNIMGLELKALSRLNFEIESLDVQKSGEYSLIVSSDMDFISNLSHDDFGNTPSYASLIETEKEVSGKFHSTEDVDCFYFTPDNKGIYSISSQDNLQIQIMDSANNPITLYQAKLAENTKNYYLRAHETYYISIYNIISSDSNYSFIMKGPTPDDFYNTYEKCNPLKINTPVKGRINYSGDVDIFRFYLPYETENAKDIYIKIDSNQQMSFNVFNTYIGDFNAKIVNNNILTFNTKYFSSGYIAVGSIDETITGDYTITASDNLDDLLPGTYKLNGYVNPEYTNTSTKINRSGFLVSLAGTQMAAFTDENGYFEINNIPKSSSAYDISISKLGYLRRNITGITIDKNTVLSKVDKPIVLWAGDLDNPQDNKINLSDIIKFAKSFNSIKGDQNFDESTDCNGDSSVNLLDVMIVARHFNQASNDYPYIDVLNY